MLNPSDYTLNLEVSNLEALPKPYQPQSTYPITVDCGLQVISPRRQIAKFRPPGERPINAEQPNKASAHAKGPRPAW